jgi:hypothetical protein
MLLEIRLDLAGSLFDLLWREMMAKTAASARTVMKVTCRTKEQLRFVRAQVAFGGVWGEGVLGEGGLDGGGWADGGLEDVGIPAPIGVPLNATTGTSPQRLRSDDDPDTV